MFERFTDQAIKVIMIAQEEARRLGHNFVGAEFIFLGLIGEATGIASQVLRQQGITLKNARIEVEKILGRGSGISPEMSPVDIPFTESAKLVLNNAVSIARQLEHESINTEHLLIGIIQEGESTARILQNLRVNPKDLTVSLNRYFQHQPSNQLPQTVYVLLYNVGTDNEGIHTISVDDNHKILLFESQEDAATFVQQLGEQNFPVPSVEAIEAEDILGFCQQQGYDWDLVPEGENRNPPREGVIFNQATSELNDSKPSLKIEYLELIEKIMSTASEDDEKTAQLLIHVLEENLELLGEELLETMMSVAQQLENEGQKEISRVITTLAQQGLPELFDSYEVEIINSANQPQSYFELFIKLLELSSAPSASFNHFLKKNLDKLDNSFIEVINDWGINTFSTFEKKTVEYTADALVNLGNKFQEFPLGNISINQEIAITFHKISLTFFKFDDFPYDWAISKNNLGNAYVSRRKGNIADNIEEAIGFLNEALKVYAFNNYPFYWSTTLYNLGNAYFHRIQGDKANNIEEAIKCYTEFLTVRTLNAYPYEWARNQNALGNIYIDRIKGNKADNIEMAINFCNESLKVRTLTAYPYDWAFTKMILGDAYQYRIRGNKSNNIKESIKHYTESLQVFTINFFPYDWAYIKNGLALVYLYRTEGELSENQEMAKSLLIEALQVYTYDNDLVRWAMIQGNLAQLYSERKYGNRENNLKKAIYHSNETLKVFTFDAFPERWAATQNNLGLIYRNLNQIPQAIEAFRLCLKVATPTNFPLKCANLGRNLGDSAELIKDWETAIEGYSIAIKAVENARLEALNPQDRQEILSNAIDVFHHIVQAHLNLNQPEKALEYIERSKGRNLVELITQKNLHPQGVSPEIIAQLNELKQRVVNEQIRLHHQSINQNLMRSDNLTPYVQDHSYLKEYQQDLDNFIAREIKDPLFSLTQKVEPIPFTEIQALTDAETCLLQWYITGEKILAFVVSAEGEIKVWQSSEDNVKQLVDVFLSYLQLYDSENGKQEWRNQLSNLLQTFADTLHINDILALIPDTCQRLIIIPHLFLHILPLHALPVDPPQLPLKRGESATGGSELQDLFPKGVQYAPSCQILQKISQTFHHSDFNKLFAIQNPTKDLFYTDLEVNILSTFFTEPQVIAKDNATKNAVLPHLKSSDNHCYHFSCHGGFNPDNPLESALFLANKEPLTLGEIFELRLNQCRLVTLAACETGVIDLNISDEYIGLPSGFLFAGSPSVVSSLWTVNDLSTSFLMIKLYEILFDANMNISVPVALKQAQNWLQNLTVQEYLNQLNSCQEIVKLMQQKLTTEEFKRLIDMIEDEQIRIKGFELNYKLFENPFYWAAFTAAGI
jgi:CHAT domain-containing protein